MNSRISLFLMAYKGYVVLDNLINEFGAEFIALVITARDLHMQKDYYTDIVDLCKKNKIPVQDRSDAYVIDTAYCYAVSWHWLIDVKDQSALIVFHDSLLPKYRGFSPLVSALINKEEKTGVTALFGHDEYDKGDIIAQASVNISYPIKIADAISLITASYTALVAEVSRKIIAGEQFVTYKQDETRASYSLWRDDEDYKIDWTRDASFLRRFIDAVGYPYKGAYTFLHSEKVRISEVIEIEDVVIENRDCGKVIFTDDGAPVVVCGKGLLKIVSLVDEEGNHLLPLESFRIRFT